MFKRVIAIAIVAGLPLVSTAASAQSNCGTKLYCLIPAALQTTSSTFNLIQFLQ